MRIAIFLRAGLLFTLAIVGAAKLPAQTRISDSHDCGSGVELRLSSSTAVQGNLLEADVHTASPLAKLDAEWAEHKIPFWTDDANPNARHALLGIDLERPAGHYELVLNGQLESGQQVSCSAFVSVEAGTFAVEKLTVKEKFVELNPDDVARANAEKKRLLDLFALATPDRLWRGRFRLPLDGVHTGGNFGRRRVLNGKPGSPHTGVDFPAAAGTLVHATQRGRVVLAEELFFSGNTVILDHGLGIYTLYGHFESISVAAGDLVDAGTILGKVGATGRVTGPHLHWGLTVNGARVNPLQIVRLGMAK
jgi:murein DD-endopeptidase MepM/ murein hydrolase activator NlpD